MGDRFYCPICHKAMTGQRALTHKLVHRCDDCVSVARARLQVVRADFKERSKGPGGRMAIYNYK